VLELGGGEAADPSALLRVDLLTKNGARATPTRSWVFSLLTSAEQQGAGPLSSQLARRSVPRSGTQMKIAVGRPAPNWQSDSPDRAISMSTVQQVVGRVGTVGCRSPRRTSRRRSACPTAALVVGESRRPRSRFLLRASPRNARDPAHSSPRIFPEDDEYLSDLLAGSRGCLTDGGKCLFAALRARAPRGT